MPASLPGSTRSQNLGNPDAGPAVIFDPLSGPKASPFDKDNTGNTSTGALSTGIGFGSPPILGPDGISPQFTDDYIPGQTLPSGAAATTSILMYTGGGRCLATEDGIAAPDPYTAANVGLCMAGNGGSRDGGTTPFTGFPIKTVTATGAVANGGAVETGFANRSGVSIVSGQSVFGASTTPLADVA